MKRSDLIAVVCVALIFWPQLQNMLPALKFSTDQPKIEIETFGFEDSVPATFDGDSAGAARIAGLCEGLADRIMADGKRENPRIKYCITIFEVRQAAVDISYDGGTINGKFPEFGNAVKEIFEKNIPRGDDPLDSNLRGKAVDLFQGLAQVCRGVK